jgi:flotillin
MGLWLQTLVPGWLAAAVATVPAFGAAALTAWLMRLMLRAESSGSLRLAGAVGATGIVYAAQAELQVNEAEAYQKGETRKRIAEAAVVEAENLARAKAAVAEAERIEAQRRAELEAPAKAEKARRIVEAEAVAEARRLEAQGEAAAIFAKLEAEARGEYEMLAKRAEGLERIVKACGGADEAYRMLMIEHIPTLADKAVEAISSIKFDKVVMWGGPGQNGSAGARVSSFIADVMASLPPALHTMLNIGGIRIADGAFKVVDDEAEGAKPAPPAVPGAPAKPKPTGQ